jgi:hypothetical protein
MNYSQYVSFLQTFAAENNVDASFMNVGIPNIINYAEQRIYKELDLLTTRVRDSSGTLTTGSRNFTVPSEIIVIEGMNVITPAGDQPDSGTRNPLVPTTRDFIDAVYPNSATEAVPEFFAPITQGGTPTYNNSGTLTSTSTSLVIVGPAPDQNYTVEVIGTFRPAPLSATNPTTFLSLYLPDLFMAASMIFTSAYQKNFSAISDNPQMSQSWESNYQKLLKSAYTEEARKKWSGNAWRARYPDPTQPVTPLPPRGQAGG